jgi:type I restriction enzyme S subunit
MWQTRVLPRDVLLNITGASIGRTCTVPDLFPLANVNQHVCIIRLRKSVNPSFVGYALKSTLIKDQIRSLENGSSREGLNFEQVGNLVIQLPDTLEEQQAIVTFLDHKTGEIDGVIAAKERMIRLLAEKRQALISRAVTRGLDLAMPLKDSGIEWLGPVPAHWELKPLGFMVNLRGGATPSKDNRNFWDGNIPWVSPKDMKTWELGDSEDHVTEAAIHQTSLTLVQPPAVLLVVRGMILSHTVPVALTTAPVTINQDMKALMPMPGCSAKFLAHLLRAVMPAFLAIVEESGHGTKCLRTELWKKLPMPLPPLREQERITAHIDREAAFVDRLIMLNGEQISKLREYRQTLTSAAVTGKIDVRQEVS